MLLFEHPTTPEGQLTKRAMQELKELREEIAEVRAMIEDENLDRQSQYRNRRTNGNGNSNSSSYKKKFSKRRWSWDGWGTGWWRRICFLIVFLCLFVRKCCKDMLGVKVLVSFELFFHLFHIEVFSVGFHTENTRRITNLTFWLFWYFAIKIFDTYNFLQMCLIIFLNPKV